VRGKIFAGMSADGATGTLKLGIETQARVLDACPTVFFPASGAWGRTGWTQLHLAKASLATLQSLVKEAWSLTAPRRLVTDSAIAPLKPAKKASRGNQKRT
jgi:hypothetical protein